MTEVDGRVKSFNELAENRESGYTHTPYESFHNKEETYGTVGLYKEVSNNKKDPKTGRYGKRMKRYGFITLMYSNFPGKKYQDPRFVVWYKERPTNLVDDRVFYLSPSVRGARRKPDALGTIPVYGFYSKATMDVLMEMLCSDEKWISYNGYKHWTFREFLANGDLFLVKLVVGSMFKEDRDVMLGAAGMGEVLGEWYEKVSDSLTPEVIAARKKEEEERKIKAKAKEADRLKKELDKKQAEVKEKDKQIAELEMIARVYSKEHEHGESEKTESDESAGDSATAVEVKAVQSEKSEGASPASIPPAKRRVRSQRPSQKR